MAQKNDKKTIIILLIVLIVSIISGGLWTYNNLKPPDEPATYLTDSDLSINEVFAIKEDIIQNIGDFLETNNNSDNIWDNFYNNKQFNKLQDIDLSIDIDRYSNNPHPFVIPSSTIMGTGN
ncbi:MAG: hypothetical protein WCS88_01560 [Patescibacteria group bacterium]|jgi:hypothetical protein